ncbi:MAG: M56 family metallopeptidase [Gemmatimonadota bacterium]
MNTLLGWLATPSFAIALLVKGSLVLVAAALLTMLLRRASPALRHGVCAIATVSLLGLPIVMATVPELRVPLLPSKAAATTFPLGNLDRLETASPSTVVPMSGAASNEQSAGFERNWPWALWLLGATVMVLWLVTGRAVLRGVRRRAVPATSTWLNTLTEEQSSLGMSSRVDVLISSEVSTPLTWGIRRPVIVLPAEASEWDDERRRIVMRHELAHVERRDTLTQVIAGIACAVYWFHPGVWWVSRRLRIERESACDDVVLAGGIKGTVYAGHLLEVASASRALNLSGMVSIAMARPSSFEGRLLAVLDDTRPRDRRRGIPASALPFVMVAVLLIAAFRPVPDTATAQPKSPAAPVIPTPAPAEPSDRVKDEISSLSTPASEPNLVSQSTQERTARFRVPSGGTLYLTLQTGGSIDVVGSDEGEVSIVATLEGTETDLRMEKVTGGVQVWTAPRYARSSSRTNHRFRIVVPTQYNVRIESMGGGVRIRDLDGNIRGHTAGGAIDIERAHGRLELGTGGGSVDVSDSDLTGSVSTGGGEVLIRNVTGGLRGSSGSGDVTYSNSSVTIDANDMTARRPGSIRLDLNDVPVLWLDRKRSDTRSASDRESTEPRLLGQFPAPAYTVNRAGGAIRLDRVPDGAMLTTGGGEIIVREASGFLAAYTGGGDITIGSARGGVEANTGAGDVEITVPSMAGAAVDISVTTGKGRVILNLPADASAVLDLDATYTRSAIEPAVITSDFNLDVSTPSEWDSSMGSPRRHVRGSGTIGNGTGKIRVRTVNGDIIVRRS